MSETAPRGKENGPGWTPGPLYLPASLGPSQCHPESEGKYHERPALPGCGAFACNFSGLVTAVSGSMSSADRRRGPLSLVRYSGHAPPCACARCPSRPLWAASLGLGACPSLVNCFSTDRHRRHCWPSAHADFRRPVTRLATDRLMRGWHWRSSAVLNSLPIRAKLTILADS